MTRTRLLITGVPGFVGSWLCRHWKEHHPEVELWGTSVVACDEELPPTQHRQVDLRDAEAVASLVGECRPSAVIHLAGLVGAGSLKDHLDVNVLGTQNLYEALERLGEGSTVRIVQVGSAAVYGKVSSSELPVVESQELRPLSAYAISKAAQDFVAGAASETTNLQIVRARIFNLLGPGQPDNLVPMTFIRQLLDCKRAMQSRLRVGNVDTRRDFIDVRDVGFALDLLLSNGEQGAIYNIGSGEDISIAKMIRLLMEIANVKVPFESTDSRTRRVDIPCIRADISKLKYATGWRRQIPLRDSLWAMWNDAARKSGAFEK